MPAPKKLDDASRAKVARFLRQMRTDKEDKLKPAMDFLNAAINDRQLSSNEDLAELEEVFDTLREFAQGIPFKTMEEKTEHLLLQQLSDDNKKFTVEGAGTVSSTESKKWSIKDLKKLLNYVTKTGDFDCFTQTVRKTWADDYYAKHGKLPPGCDFFPKKAISFTKERQKAGAKK